MKTMLMSAAAAAGIAVLAGCVTIPPGAERGPHGTMAYFVKIDASEPGTLIKANGQDIGTVPLTLKIYGDPDGTFHDFGSYYYVIQAFPPSTNLFTQTKVFRTGHLFTPEDVIPHEINFDMTKPSVMETPMYIHRGYPAPGYYYGPGYY
jgi:hypothetical protein